jgi:hypothetical protein
MLYFRQIYILNKLGVVMGTLSVSLIVLSFNSNTQGNHNVVVTIEHWVLIVKVERSRLASSFKKIHFLAPSNLVDLFYNKLTGKKKKKKPFIWHLRKVVIVETPIKCCS